MSFFTPNFGRTAVMAGLLSLGAMLTPASAAESTPQSKSHSEALDNISISIGDYIVSPNANLTLNTPYGSASSGDVSSHQVHIPPLKADFLLGHSQGFAFDYYGFYRQYSDSVSRTLFHPIFFQHSYSFINGKCNFFSVVSFGFLNSF